MMQQVLRSEQTSFLCTIVETLNEHFEKRTTSVEQTNCQYTISKLLPSRQGQLLTFDNGRHTHRNMYIFQICRGMLGLKFHKPHKLDSMDGSVQATQGIGGPHKYPPLHPFFIFPTNTKLFPVISRHAKLKDRRCIQKMQKNRCSDRLLVHILLCPVFPAHCHPHV